MNSKLFKIGGLVCSYYSCGVKTETVVIYGIGAPIVPDNGTLPDAPVLTQFGTDVLVPDYYGYGRSDGVFTPGGCVETFVDLYRAVSEGAVGKNSYLGLVQKLRYERVIVMGRSFGANYAMMATKLEPGIREVGLVSPCVENESQGSVAGEESNEVFMRSMKEDGYAHLYRGILELVWWQHLEGNDEWSAMQNVEYFGGVKVFLGHGGRDGSINYTKSEKFYNKLVAAFPGKRDSFRLEIYSNGDHGSSTTNQACSDFMAWLGLVMGEGGRMGKEVKEKNL